MCSKLGQWYVCGVVVNTPLTAPPWVVTSILVVTTLVRRGRKLPVWSSCASSTVGSVRRLVTKCWRRMPRLCVASAIGRARPAHAAPCHAVPCCLMYAIPHEWKCAAATFACWPVLLIPCVSMEHNAAACMLHIDDPTQPLGDISTRRARQRTAKARAVSTTATAAATAATAAMHIDRPCTHASTPTSGWCRTAGWPGHP